jgi:hypothetical protein
MQVAVDGPVVGGCSFMIRVRHAAAAIAAGLCETVLITHGESGRSGVGRTRNVVAPTSLAGQFEQPYDPRAAGPGGPSRGRRLCSRSQCSATSRPMGSRTSNWRWSRSCSANGGEEPARHLQDASASRASRGRLAMTWR